VKRVAYGIKVGRWYLGWRDPWTRRWGFTLDNGVRSFLSHHRHPL